MGTEKEGSILTFESALKIVATAITSLGGGAAIVIAVSRWLSGVIADKLQKKNELFISKQLEQYKHALEKRNYISKVRFDLEIQTFQELSEAFVLMTQSTVVLFPLDDALLETPTIYPEDNRLRMLRKALEDFSRAAEALAKRLPFISKEMGERFLDIKLDCEALLFCHQGGPSFLREPESKIYKDCVMRTKRIEDNFGNLIDAIRDYLSTLDVDS